MVLIHSNYQPGLTQRQRPFYPEREHEENCRCLPAANILKYDDHAEIQLFVPGRSKEDFNINLEDDMITISAEDKAAENGEFIQQEFAMDEFKRNFQIADLINQDNVSAAYEAGILKINLPFREEQKPQSRDIQIS